MHACELINKYIKMAIVDDLIDRCWIHNVLDASTGAFYLSILYFQLRNIISSDNGNVVFYLLSIDFIRGLSILEVLYS